MARFNIDPNRINYNIERSGKEYNLRVLQRAQTIFTTLLNLLPSPYTSAIQGPNYTVELKAMAVEMAKIELSLEDVDLDRDFTHTRSEFLYSMIGYLVFLNNKLPPLEFSDEEFRKFLLALIKIYFQGSVPESIKDAVSLFLTQDFNVLENFLLTRQGSFGLDLSDEFGFQIQIAGGFPPDLFNIQSSLRIILDVVRPAHTLYTLRFIFTDDYHPNDETGKVLDAMRMKIADYHYDDVRAYWNGFVDRDRLGRKVNQTVISESHSF